MKNEAIELCIKKLSSLHAISEADNSELIIIIEPLLYNGWTPGEITQYLNRRIKAGSIKLATYN